MKKNYNKLVRDKIPQIIESKGGKATITKLNDNEYLKELNKKLQEEINEYLFSEEVEELADIQEVIYAIVKAKGIKINDFETIRLNKVEKRGAFENKIFLVDVEE